MGSAKAFFSSSVRSDTELIFEVLLLGYIFDEVGQGIYCVPDQLDYVIGVLECLNNILFQFLLEHKKLFLFRPLTQVLEGDDF